MASGLLPSFRKGQKELFLPTAQIALLRSKNLPPTQARFRVPLNFSKLDLRDYLFHAYNTRILSVRSVVRLSRVQSDHNNAKTLKAARSRWHRPKAKKFMTVELERPFVWPEEPESYDEWNAKEVKLSEVEQKENQKKNGSLRDAWINQERRDRMREQARELLEGRVKWRSGAEIRTEKR